MIAIDNQLGPMRNLIIQFILSYFKKVTAPRHGVSDWEISCDFDTYHRFRIDFSAVLENINKSHASLLEWFDIPKYFRKQYTKDLSQSNLNLDSSGTALYGANVQLQQLAFKSYFGPDDDIDPQDMFLINFYLLKQWAYGKETLKLLQKNMNRVLKKRNSIPPQDGVHLCFWIHLILSSLESTFAFPLHECSVSQTIFSISINRRLILAGIEYLQPTSRGVGDAKETLDLLRENS
jgi:hypothetical protein